jgi:ABC-type iron transport system FetAB permease component
MIHAFVYSPLYYVANIVLVAVVTIASLRTRSRLALTGLVFGAAVIATFAYFARIPGNAPGFEPIEAGPVAAVLLGGLLPFVVVVVAGSNRRIRERPIRLRIGVSLAAGWTSLLVLSYLQIYLVCLITGTCL